jgi:nicotinic acid mononucleotide adenylyltransferase
VLHELGLPPFGDAAGPVLFHAASLPISGSDLRRRARENRSLAYRMPESVAAYIREHGLYRAP